jgi:hypothetical protein
MNEQMYDDETYVILVVAGYEFDAKYKNDLHCRTGTQRAVVSRY